MLPKDFEGMLKEGDLDKLKGVFEVCDVNARGGAGKHTALAFNDCPDELARWLVERGIDLSATDTWGNTALHERARHYRKDVKGLLELGADVHHAGPSCGTPLHAAADSCSVHNARLLIEHGAKVDARNRDGLSPLEYALKRAHNARLPELAALCDVLLAAGADRSARTKELIERIGQTFEFHRAGFNQEAVSEASAALDHLYELFDVLPVARRRMHDGSSPIVPCPATWPVQHDELWQLLVPSKGPAATAQGEVIRISGKIGDEISRNGGVNWDADYQKMAEAFLALIAEGSALSAPELAEIAGIVAEGKHMDRYERLAELAVEWVKRNPTPADLGVPAYRR
ncbi:ankyrin repeat domain-containing protein [Steroidobacter cummioxidans]|uniref:ankyrin repeat domain-containing protein n=1 Tax=Steroidobacter cummioxidans TaxID=1803913 RepID=UPI000E323B8A|nr:ankyrin repeat domain-containing protein [Steroidobacter cummioxidans]